MKRLFAGVLISAVVFSGALTVAGDGPEEEARLEGINVWPEIVGRSKGRPRTLYWMTGGQYGLRHGDWKLITSRDGKQPERVAELKEILADKRKLDP